MQLPSTYRYFQKNLKQFNAQYDQDGIIEAIFDIIKTRNKYFVEIGGGNSIDNTYYLRHSQGWDGLLFNGGIYLIGTQFEPLLRNVWITSDNVI